MVVFVWVQGFRIDTALTEVWASAGFWGFAKGVRVRRVLFVGFKQGCVRTRSQA